MQIFLHAVNSLFPSLCSCCRRNWSQPRGTLCLSCRLFFKKTFKLHQWNVRSQNRAVFGRDREVFFQSLYYLAGYRSLQKNLYQTIKFENDSFNRKYLLTLFMQIMAPVMRHAGYVIPAPSSHGLLNYFSQKMEKQYGMVCLKAFKKERKVQNKNLSRPLRFLEMEKSLGFIPGLDWGNLKEESKKIIVLDDIWTTGATLNRMCRSLVYEGVRKENIVCMVFFVKDKITDVLDDV